MQTSTLAASKMDYFMTLQLKVSIVNLNYKELHLMLHIKKKLFPKTKKDFCSMIDVSQVLEFPSGKLYLLKQLPVTNITHISTLKLTLNRSRLFGGGRLMEGPLILPQGFRRNSSIKEGYV